MKIRIDNYKLAYLVFQILNTICFGLFKAGVIFDEIYGVDYKERSVDHYYLIQIKGHKKER